MIFIRFAAMILAISLSAQVRPPTEDHSIPQHQLSADAQLYPEYFTGLTINAMLAEKKDRDDTHTTNEIVFHQKLERRIGGSLPETFVSQMQGQTYNSDAVILGTPLTYSSAPTSSNEFVFSDYLFKIQAAVADRSRLLEGRSSVIISRAGGVIKVGQSIIQATVSGFPLFTLGKQYLIFLHRAPSGSFAIRGTDAFQIEHGSVYPASADSLEPTDNESLSSILGVVANAAALNLRKTQ